MRTIRKHVFETNSSSCHCLTTISKDQLLDLFHNQSTKIIHIPDTGEYQTSDKYEIMSVEDALEFYNTNVDVYNERYKRFNEHLDKFKHSWTFMEALNNAELSTDEIFGKFLNYGQLMSSIEPTTDGKVDLIWWNNC